MKTLKTFGILCAAFLLGACSNERSLQKYYVDNQENKDFMAIDVPASMFTNAEALEPEERKTMETIKKINVLAIPKKLENQVTIDAEKINIANILEDEKYELLMKYGSGNSKVEIYFTGEEDAVDEIIVYGFDEERGMGLARVLGEDMNPGDILNLIKSLEKGDVDLDGLKGITTMFLDKTE